MIFDLDTGLPDLPTDAVVVIGSGAAGIALTQRLNSAGRRVVLLESGPLDPDLGGENERDLNGGSVHGLVYRGLQDGRSRTLGGTTELWHGQCMRLHDLNLRSRGWVPESGWPLALPDIARSYPAAERWLGVTGGYGAERWADHPRLPPIAWNSEHLEHDFTEYTARPILGQVHRRSLSSEPLAVVVTNATVAAIDLVDGALRGVQVVAPNGTRVRIPAVEVVLAAGAVENARILQLSDPAGVGLGTGRDQTGRYLQDHPIIRTAEVRSHDYRVLQDRYVALHRGRQRLFPKVRLATTAQQQHGLLDATAVFVHDHDQPALTAARRLVLAARARRAPDEPWRDLAAALRAPAPVVRDVYRRYLRGLSTANRPSAVWLQLWLEQEPNPQSRIVLGTDTDRLGLRRPVVDWRVSDLELHTSRVMTRWIGEDLGRLGLGTLRELAPMTDDDAWRADVHDAYHPSGTTRMSADPTQGVVDADLQVHGVPGLFVVGGSVFPIAGYANPTLTIVALAMRLADHLCSPLRTVAP